ncbi:hypothetical protein HBH43_235160 [Parastagonospora nodorum]|nr:hypothetical protein HBH43_235160 [Parastagonospora nodorum]
MCAKDDLIGRKGLLLTSTQMRLAGELAIAESVTAKDPNHVDTFSLDFAFSFAAWLQRIKCMLGDNILLLIAFIISYRLFADELVYALRDVAAWLVYVTIGNLSPLENAAKSGILLACADGRIRQCYLTICAILADYEEQVLLTGVKKNRYCTRCTLVAVVSLLFVSKAPFALYFIRAVCDLVTLAQYKRALERMNVFKEEFRVYRRTLGEEKNFNYPKWHALTHIIQDIRMYRALDGICTGANSEAHYITMVKQFYSMTNKKEYILQICLHNSRRTALLAADYATVVKQNCTYSTRVTRSLPFCRLRWLIPGIQPYLTKLPLSEVAANIAISDFTHAVAVFDCLDVDLSWVGCMSVQIHPSIKCWRSSGKRHNDPEHCDEEVVRCAPNWQQIGLWRRDYVWLYLILTIIDHICYDKDGKYMAYIGAFSEVLLFNNNEQIDNTTGMLSVRRRAWNAASKRWILQAFKFYDLSTIIRLVHLVPRDLPDLITRTTMSYYVNNYIDWDEYNRLYSLTFDIDLLRTLREYRRKRTRNN